MTEPLPYHPAWPAIPSAIPRDEKAEEAIRRIVAQMTLSEKVGQMIQPELKEVTPEEAAEYKFGSALNGAGVFPGGNRHASAAEWVATTDAFWNAAERAYADRPFRIPFMWATDAVHGHNNVFGATLFPHNIGLGAAGDADLLRRIGRATAREIAATGMDWTFAPNVATPRDRRWGRYYEGYSEDPEIVAAYSAAMVEGLQGEGPAGELSRDDRVIACLKHWVGDGGTAFGVDRGDCRSSEDVLRNVHAAGYFSGLAAGAQSVMASFSGWANPLNYDHSPDPEAPYNGKISGSRYLLTDVLKDMIGFDGIVLTDWDAHGEVPRCSLGDAGYCINAGVDMLMVAGRKSWQSIHALTQRQVRAGHIPIGRIDDAVTRILRVKMRAGLWDKPRPAERSLAGRADVLGCAEHRAIAREAVRKSLVLLKNEGGVLPLSPHGHFLVTGSGADEIRKQTGGWTVSWQGTDVGLPDLPGGSTIAMAVRDVVGKDRCILDPELRTLEHAHCDAAIVAIGEDSYAEMRGTLRPWRSLEYSRLKKSYVDDLRILRELRGLGIPVVTIFLGGRPLYVTEEINLSDAFVAAWLPGSDAAGIADLLFAGEDGRPAHDFAGRLSVSWPRTKHSAAINRTPRHMPAFAIPKEEQDPSGLHAPLFAYGHGLDYGSSPAERDVGPIPLDRDDRDEALAPAEAPFDVPSAPGGPFRWRMTGDNMWSGEEASFEEPVDTPAVHTAPERHFRPGDALRVRFKGGMAGLVYARTADGVSLDLRAYAAADGSIQCLVKLFAAPEAPLYLACHDDYPSQPGIDIAAALRAMPLEEWTLLSVRLRDLAELGSDLEHVDTPFMLYSEGRADLAVADVRWLPGTV
jgi:beta-glucosidase